MSGEKLIGYLCAIPIDNKFYNKIRAGKVTEDVKIPVNKVLNYYPGNKYNIYIFSVVIHPEYQGTSSVFFLLNGFINNLLKLIKKGIEFDKVLADAVSEKGLKIATSLGLERICNSNHSSTILETNVYTMIQRYTINLE